MSTRGIILFAVDTESRSYAKMADYCASQIKQHLKLPITVVTTGGVDKTLFDDIIIVKSDRKQQRSISGRTEHWNNFDRYSAYELSPYDRTIVLDTDYICNSDQLLKLFEIDNDILCHRTRRYLGARYESIVEQFAKNHDMWWATVVYFKKNPIAESVFDMMKMIQNNYEHYSKIYGFKSSPYRNDYALSIALNTVYGHVIPSSVEIPWSLINVEFNTQVELSKNIWSIVFEKHVGSELKRHRITTENQDLHILNKDALERIIDDTE